MTTFKEGQTFMNNSDGALLYIDSILESGELNLKIQYFTCGESYYTGLTVPPKYLLDGSFKRVVIYKNQRCLFPIEDVSYESL